MHPIERLRFVARSRGAPADLLVQEAAGALGAFRSDPAGMVAACRRIIDRQLTCGPLWWLCARILSAPEPMVEARAAVEELSQDPTGSVLAQGLPDDAVVAVVGWPEQSLGALRRRGDLQVLAVDVAGEADELVEHLARVGTDAEAVHPRHAAEAVAAADAVLLDALVAGPDAALLPAGSLSAAAVAAHTGTESWLVAGAGRWMPASMYGALVDRWSTQVEPLQAFEEQVALSLVDRVAGVGGLVAVDGAMAWIDCPVAPELFRLTG